MSLTNKKTGVERFVTGAFPSACGKTNLAMLLPGIPDYEVKTIGQSRISDLC